MQNDENLLEILEKLEKKECNLKDSIAMIESCPKLIKLNNLEEELFIIFNGPKIYGFIIFEDEIELYIRLELSEQKVVFKMKKNIQDDYVIQSLLKAIKTEYLRKILNIKGTETINEELKILRNANLNSKGYKIR